MHCAHAALNARWHAMILRPVRIAIVAGPALGLVLAAFTPGSSAGLPSFSRAYAAPCQRCHGTFSGLNHQGMAFLQSGFRQREDAGFTRRPARLPMFSVVADLNQDFATADSGVGAGPVRDRDRDRDSESRQGSVELHAAGTLSGHLSFHLEAQLPTRAGSLVSNTAFVQLDDLVRNGGLNLKIGEYRVSGPYLALSRPARFADYLTLESLPARGLEFSGTSADWTYGAGFVQSQRARSSANSATRMFGPLEDTYLRLDRDLGRQRVGVRMLFDRQDSNLPGLAWLQHLQAQASALLEVGRFELVPAYSFDRFDDRPAGGLHQRRQTALIEARVSLDDARRWKLTAFAEHDYTTRTRYSPEADHHQEALELGFGVRQGAELAVEYVHAGDNVGGPQVERLNTYLRLGY